MKSLPWSGTLNTRTPLGHQQQHQLALPIPHTADHQRYNLWLVHSTEEWISMDIKRYQQTLSACYLIQSMTKLHLRGWGQPRIFMETQQLTVHLLQLRPKISHPLLYKTTETCLSRSCSCMWVQYTDGNTNSLDTRVTDCEWVHVCLCDYTEWVSLLSSQGRSLQLLNYNREKH